MKVKDAMHKGVDWVSPDTPVTEIAKLMREHDIGAIPIGENDRLIGMVTDRDIVVRFVAEGKDPSNARVNECMSKSVRSVKEDTPVTEILSLMSNAQIRRVPVVNASDELVGIVSIRDISTETNQDGKVGKTISQISEGPANN